METHPAWETNIPLSYSVGAIRVNGMIGTTTSVYLSLNCNNGLYLKCCGCCHNQCFKLYNRATTNIDKTDIQNLIQFVAFLYPTKYIYKQNAQSPLKLYIACR